MPRTKSRNSVTGSNRVNALDWPAIASELDGHGSAVVGPLLTPEECGSLIEAYDTESLYRRRIVMAQHGYGRGEYQYFAYPLPPLIAELRIILASN